MIQCASIHAHIYRRHGIVVFFHLQITIARAYISKSIHVAFRNESSLNIYVHICFLNENCYRKSRAECEKSRSSQPYFPYNTKISLSSVSQWERGSKQIDIENVRFSMHVSKFDCIRFVVVRRLLLFCSRVTSFFSLFLACCHILCMQNNNKIVRVL